MRIRDAVGRGRDSPVRSTIVRWRIPRAVAFGLDAPTEPALRPWNAGVLLCGWGRRGRKKAVQYEPTVQRPLRVARQGSGRSWVRVTGHGSPERDWSLLRAPLQATPLGVAAADAQS